MRPSILSILLLLFGCASPLPAQPKEGLPEDAPKGKLDVYLETGGHSKPILRAGFTKDDKRLITVGKDGSIQIWDVATGKRLKKLLLPVATEYYCAALSPDDRTVAVSVLGEVSEGAKKYGYGVMLVNLDDGRILPLSGDLGVAFGGVRYGLEFSPAGDQLAGGNDTVLRVWPNMDKLWDKAFQLDVKQRAEMLTPRSYPKMLGLITRVQFSPNNKQIIATILASKGEHLLFDASPGGETKPALPLQIEPAAWQSTRAQSCAWSDDSKSLFLGHTGKIGVTHWDHQGQSIKKYNWPKLMNAEETKDWFGLNAKINQLFLLGEDTLLMGGNNLLHDGKDFAGCVGFSVLDLKTGKMASRFKATDLTEELSLTTVTHDKQLAATTVNSGRDLLLWNVADGKVVRRIESKAQTPVRVGWLKDKNRYVLAWGYGTDPTDKDFGRFSRAFDLDKLAFVNEVKPADYVGRIHHFGTWSAGYKLKDSRVVLEAKNEGKQTFAIGNTVSGISAFTFLPGDGGEPALIYGFGSVLRMNNAKTGKPGKNIVMNWPHTHDLACSPDGRFMAVASGLQQITIYSLEATRVDPVMDLYCAGQEWVAFARASAYHTTPTGHYAASPGGEKLMGWVVNNNLKTQATFHPASRFRKQFYRPDVVRLILKEGNFAKALKAANAKLKAQGGKAQNEVNLETVLPPGGFIDKVDSSKLPRIIVHASAFAADAQDPLTRLELLADGRPLFGSAGVQPLPKPQTEAVTTFAVDLPPGSYKLTMRMSTARTWSVSTEAQVIYAPAGSYQQPKAKLHMLAIGASVYKNHPGLDLPSPANDAKKIAETLPKQCGLPLFAPGSGQAFVGTQATSANVYQAIKDLSKQVKAEDVAVIYFGGHGLKAPTGGLYLLTYDTDMKDLDKTALSGKKLRDELSKIECRGVILILDACHSGALGLKTKPVVDDLTRELADDDCGVVVWCSAMGHEKAQVDNKSGHGLFTLNLLKALDPAKGASPDKYDGKVYLNDLQAYIFSEVRHDSGNRQHPSLNLPSTVEAFPLRQVAKQTSKYGE